MGRDRRRTMYRQRRDAPFVSVAVLHTRMRIWSAIAEAVTEPAVITPGRPCGPVRPWRPCGPVRPCRPSGPVRPVRPCGPAPPTSPEGPARRRYRRRPGPRWRPAHRWSPADPKRPVHRSRRRARRRLQEVAREVLTGDRAVLHVRAGERAVAHVSARQRTVGHARPGHEVAGDGRADAAQREGDDGADGDVGHQGRCADAEAGGGARTCAAAGWTGAGAECVQAFTCFVYSTDNFTDRGRGGRDDLCRSWTNRPASRLPPCPWAAIGPGHQCRRAKVRSAMPTRSSPRPGIVASAATARAWASPARRRAPSRPWTLT